GDVDRERGLPGATLLVDEGDPPHGERAGAQRGCSGTFSSLDSIRLRVASRSAIFRRRDSTSSVDGRFIAASAERRLLSSTPLASSVRWISVWIAITNRALERSAWASFPPRSSPVSTSFLTTGLFFSMAPLSGRDFAARRGGVKRARAAVDRPRSCSLRS